MTARQSRRSREHRSPRVTLPEPIATAAESSPPATPCPHCRELLDVAGRPYLAGTAPGERLYDCPACGAVVVFYSAEWL